MFDSIKEISKPSVILAGAGTGKTRAITEKAVHIIKENIFSPEKVICVTFSNEAVASLESRLKSRLEEHEMPVVRTFHGLCGDLLREHGLKIGIDSKFRVITPEDGMILLYQYFKIHALKCGQYIETIGTLKESNLGIESYEQFIQDQEPKFPPAAEQELEKLKLKLHGSKLEKSEKDALKESIDSLNTFVQQKRFLQAWRSYEKLKIKQSLLDYGDLQRQTLLLLKRYPEIAEQFSYLIVDEFQDTNKIQLDLIHSLAPTGNVTIVGDLNQSIYQFRGAYSGTFEAFKELYGIETTVKLDNSYRSPNTVLRVAHEAIKHNYTHEEDCFLVRNAEQREGAPVEVFELLNGNEEVRKIVELIELELSNGINPESICVLFRTHNQASLLKRALESRKIPYRSAKKTSLLVQPLIERIRNLGVIVEKINRNTIGGGHAWWTLARLTGFSTADLALFGKAVKDYRDQKPISDYFMNNSPELSAEGVSKLETIRSQIKTLEPYGKKQLMDFVSNAAALLGEGINESERTLLKAFTEYAQEFSEREPADIGTFLAHLDARDQLHLALSVPEASSEGVKIMTAHATKGLEYDVVIIANLVQGKFPIETVSRNSLVPESLTALQTDQQIAEERRLFYVACTRTKQKLYLLYAKRYGSKEFEESQFLKEINYLESSDITLVKDSEERAILEKPEFKEASLPTDKVLTFSPSALTLFASCQKKYEYRYVFNMPEEITTREQRALGTFVHLIIEMGVKELFTSERQFVQLAQQFALKPEWEGVNVDEATHLIRVFFERNKDKYGKESKNEQSLFLMLEGLRFIGYADRIDFHPDGIEIIDYKTGNHVPYGRERDWQLGFYALAARKMGKVRRVTLDVFKNEKPLEYELDEKGVARDSRSNRVAFTLDKVREELISTAKNIIECYQKGFVKCPAEKNCEFCSNLV